MKKLCLALLVLLCASGVSLAQDIKFKKGKVLVDGEECMTYDSSASVVEFNTKNGDQTILLKFIRTGVGPNGGLYSKVTFVEQDKSFTARSYIFNKKLLVKKLILDEVMIDCQVDESKIDKFLMRYDEGIEETLIRH